MITSSILFAPHLYLDPGSGSIILQMILAAILGAGIIIRSQWSKIKRIFGAKSTEEDDSEEGEDNSDN